MIFFIFQLQEVYTNIRPVSISINLKIKRKTTYVTSSLVSLSCVNSIFWKIIEGLKLFEKFISRSCLHVVELAAPPGRNLIMAIGIGAAENGVAQYLLSDVFHHLLSLGLVDTSRSPTRSLSA
jgi:hypothetical protein